MIHHHETIDLAISVGLLYDVKKILGVPVMKFTGKEQCWERMRCGRDRDQSCPAYPDYGRLCWPIAGTKCRGRVTGTHAREIKDCESCEFFRAVVFAGLEEG